MEYACIIWDPVPQKNIRELEMVQRKAARFVTGDYRTTSNVTRMLEVMQWTLNGAVAIIRQSDSSTVR